MGSPIWGETPEYASSLKLASNPDIWYDERQAKYGNMFKTHLLGSPTVVLLGAEANKFVLSNENKLFESSWPRSLRLLEGKYAVSMVQDDLHTRLRRAVNTFLNVNAVQRFRNRMEDIVIRQLTEGFQHSKSVIAAFPTLEKMAFQLNAELFMGLEPGPELQGVLHLYENFTAGLAAHPLNLPWTVFGKAMKSRAELLKYMFRKINERRQELSFKSSDELARDLLDLLVMSKDEVSGNYYTVEEIADNMILMVHAGQATTASTLAATLKHLSLSESTLDQLKAECRALAASQGAWNRVSREQLKDIELLRYVISEGLRIGPPVPAFFKRARCDVMYEGYTIPKGWTVHLFARNAHLNPEFFPNPQTFDPFRFEKRRGTYAYIPFGQGARICPGMEFAKVTMDLFVYHFIIRYDWQLVDPDEKIVPRTFAPYPEKGLLMRITELPSLHREENGDGSTKAPGL